MKKNIAKVEVVSVTSSVVFLVFIRHSVTNEWECRTCPVVIPERVHLHWLIADIDNLVVSGH